MTYRRGLGRLASALVAKLAVEEFPKRDDTATQHPDTGAAQGGPAGQTGASFLTSDCRDRWRDALPVGAKTRTNEEYLARYAILLEIAGHAEHYATWTGEHYWGCEYRTAAKGWKRGDPPVIECVCGLDRLNDALARFEDS